MQKKSGEFLFCHLKVGKEDLPVIFSPQSSQRGESPFCRSLITVLLSESNGLFRKLCVQNTKRETTRKDTELLDVSNVWFSFEIKLYLDEMHFSYSPWPSRSFQFYPLWTCWGKVPFSEVSFAKPLFFKFIHFEERFRKVPFSVDNLSRLVWTVGLTVTIKLRFSNLSGVV